MALPQKSIKEAEKFCSHEHTGSIEREGVPVKLERSIKGPISRRPQTQRTSSGQPWKTRYGAAASDGKVPLLQHSISL